MHNTLILLNRMHGMNKRKKNLALRNGQLY